MRKWDDLSMREKAEMMRVAVSNGITTLPEIKQAYNEFAEGGAMPEAQPAENDGWSMEDEAKYREWRSKLPSNLRNTNDNDYDMREAYKAGMQPTLEDDGFYHLGSRNPKTGRILKAPHHPTYLKAINTDARMGYYPRIEKGITYTDTWEGNLFGGGGDVLETYPTENIFGKGGKKDSNSKSVFLNSLEQSLREDSRFNSNEWRKFFTDLAKMESSYSPDITNSIGAKGYFQLMPFNRAKAWTNPTQQFHEMYKLTGNNLKYLHKNLTEKDWEWANKRGIDMYGMLAGAHLGGVGNVVKAIRGKGNAKDMNGSSVIGYMTKFSQNSPTRGIKLHSPYKLPEQEIPFTPWNERAFYTPLIAYQPVVLPDEQQPIVREATAYDPKEIERQERQRGLNNFMTLMSMASPQQDNGMLGAINMLSGLGTTNAYREGGGIHIKPENRGKFTALKERTGHSATWFKEHGTPAQKKMATFALNARHWKHGLGGNLFDGTSQPSQQIDRPNIFRYDDGVANSGLVGILQGKDDAVNIYGDGGKEKKSLKERVLGLGLWAADKIGLAKEYKGTDADTHYRRNLYNGVDPGAGYPKSVGEAMMYKRIADNARKPNVNFQKVRETNDPTADAAWAKRLGIPYNEAYLPSNRDGSVRLPRSVEAEIPVDTTFLKDRIAANQKLREKYRKSGGLSKARREAIDTGLRADMNTLDSLRTTFKTGKPVSINEMSFINRNWIDNGNAHLTPSPLSLLQNYTVRYNKNTGRMEYSDIYDFNEFENFVPGKPFNIKGSIKVGKQQKKKQ